MLMTQLDPKVQRALDAHDLTYEVVEGDPNLADTTAFVEKYGFALDQSANAIIVASRKIDPPIYALCVVLATTRLDVTKAVVKHMGINRASFADAETTKELTGMMIGGVTAPGVEVMPIYIDAAVVKVPEVIMGGGNRSSKLLLNPHELLKLPNTEVVEGLAKPSQS